MNTLSLSSLNSLLHHIHIRRSVTFSLIILSALVAFETFNYSTTEFALNDLLGNLAFIHIPWSTILAIAFCGIDFAGIARLFTPQENIHTYNELWYLFAAWLLAATMNAMLTWWGVTIAVFNQRSLGNAVIDRQTLLRVVPIFVAILVWIIRVLIIGSFSVAGTRIFNHNQQVAQSSKRTVPVRPIPAPLNPSHASNATVGFQVAHKIPSQPERNNSQPEPSYHPISSIASSKSINLNKS